MSSIDKSIVSILEGDIESMEYGVPEFNKLIKSLDSKTKNKLSKDSHSDKSDKKSDNKSDNKVLKSNNYPEIQKVLNESSQEEKKSFVSFAKFKNN